MRLLVKYVSFLILINLVQSAEVFDVTKYGADHKGVNKSTDAVKKAIEAASRNGGGTVYFPDGEYICGAIHLMDNITLHLADRAIIKFSKDFDDYLPMVRTRYEGTVVNNFSPLIYAFHKQNIAITGKGTLDGQGSLWWNEWKHLKTLKTRDNKYQKEFFRANNMSKLASETIQMTALELGFLRPTFIQPFDSKNILIEGVTIKNSPFWNVNPVFCENITVKDVKIWAPPGAPNTDGVDPDSCKDVFITNVEFDVADDCIAIKSGRDLQARLIGRPTENVVISNCTMLRGRGAVAIGSEQSAGVRNVTVKDCVFNGTNTAFFIKSTRGRGGVVENISFNNITLHKIDLAFNITMAYHGGDNDDPHKLVPFSERTPVFRNFKFENIRGDVTSHTSIMVGLPESLLDNIQIKNVNIVSNSQLVTNYTNNLRMDNFSFKKN